MATTGLRIVITGPFPASAAEELRLAGHDVEAWAGEDPIGREELLQRVRGADALITLVTEKVDEQLLDAAGPRLRIVANTAAGHDNVDLEACRSRGITVTNTPGVLEEATADLAMALILMVTRRLGEAERIVRSGQEWRWGMHYLLGSGIQGKQLGIVGLGGIARATARRAKAFGMQIAYTGRRAAPADVVTELEARQLELGELLTTSDVVSLHLPYSAAVHHLIGAAELAAMKSSAVLVNTARGPIVDEAALVQALDDRVIAGAGLDVYEHEPRIHPGLISHENAVLLPHLGSATVETRTEMARLAARNVLAVLAGEQALTPVG